jgi:hypothetical protein
LQEQKSFHLTTTNNERIQHTVIFGLVPSTEPVDYAACFYSLSLPIPMFRNGCGCGLWDSTLKPNKNNNQTPETIQSSEST